MQSPEMRAVQRLLLQGFTLYTCPAAVCTRFVAPQLLDSASHTWAVTFDASSQQWCARLSPDDPLLASFAEAAVRASQGEQFVLCSVLGERVVLQLGPDTTHARMRIEHAVTMKLSPPSETLAAYPDELIDAEARKRGLRKATPRVETLGTESPSRPNPEFQRQSPGSRS